MMHQQTVQTVKSLGWVPWVSKFPRSFGSICRWNDFLSSRGPCGCHSLWVRLDPPHWRWLCAWDPFFFYIYTLSIVLPIWGVPTVGVLPIHYFNWGTSVSWTIFNLPVLIQLTQGATERFRTYEHSGVLWISANWGFNSKVSGFSCSGDWVGLGLLVVTVRL